ncbi:MAG: hypothetical protein ABIF71_09615 [Planctomycetota bacterium]
MNASSRAQVSDVACAAVALAKKKDLNDLPLLKSLLDAASGKERDELQRALDILEGKWSLSPDGQPVFRLAPQ